MVSLQICRELEVRDRIEVQIVQRGGSYFVKSNVSKVFVGSLHRKSRLDFHVPQHRWTSDYNNLSRRKNMNEVWSV